MGYGRKMGSADRKLQGPGRKSAFADRKVKEPPEQEAKGNRWADRLFLRRRYGSRQGRLNRQARPGTLLLSLLLLQKGEGEQAGVGREWAQAGEAAPVRVYLYRR